MAAYYHLKPSGVQHMFNLKGGNHETVLTSERYLTKQGAQGGIASVKVNAPIDARYINRTSTGGAPYFVLKAANGEIIGTSEMYSTAAARDVGIAWVKTNAPTANTVE
ncbi:MAG: YegP family protein [Polaromonas sp.]|uniref:YegP family protein n=1 Tax=Polaromonas sp. TaxID=1869339 RepID=UPI0027334B6B|nr:YegP family protein [Polaromonas sp.]MDP3799793.1 YegP family protein [Polaromonas sp.]